MPDAWRALADHLGASGDEAGAENARARLLKASTRDPRLLAAGAALCENRIPEAEALLRRHLIEHPTDIAAIRMLAEVAARIGRYHDAENLLGTLPRARPGLPRRAAQLRGGAVPAGQARRRRCRRSSGCWPPRRATRTTATCRRRCWPASANTSRAIDIYVEVLKEYPRQAKIWLSYGHALKTAGQTAEGIEAYRRAIELDAAPRGGVVEPCEPQDLPLRGG